MEKLMIVIGKANDVIYACADLENKLNQFISEYDYVNPITIVIDESSSSVYHNKEVFAIQMIKKKPNDN